MHEETTKELNMLKQICKTIRRYSKNEQLRTDFWAINKVESLVFTSLYPIQFLTVKIPSCQINGTVNSLLTDTSIRRTPLLEGHLVLIPAIYKSFYCNHTLYKTDKEHI